MEMEVAIRIEIEEGFHTVHQGPCVRRRAVCTCLYAPSAGSFAPPPSHIAGCLVLTLVAATTLTATKTQHKIIKQERVRVGVVPVLRAPL